MSRKEPKRPNRPTVPFTLWLLAGAIMSSHATLAASRHMDPEMLTRMGLALAALAFVCAIRATVALRENARGARSVAYLMVCVLSMSTGTAACHGAYQVRSARRMESLSMARCVFVCLTDATEGTYGYRCRARVSCDNRSVAEVWLSCQEPLELGCRLRCVGRFKTLSLDDYGTSSWCQGICGSVRVVRILEQHEPAGLSNAIGRLRVHALELLGARSDDPGALLAGCVCGWRTGLAERELDDVFARCGCAHLVAVSGAHLSMVAALVTRVLDRLSMPPWRRILLLASITGTYVIFCGTPLSAARAWLMSLVAGGAKLAGRRSHALSAVSAVALAMLLLEPTLSGQLGFILSVFSVVGLCLFCPYAEYVLHTLMPGVRLPRGVPQPMRKLAGTVSRDARAIMAATLCCQLVTLPLTAEVFGEVSLVAPLANLVVGPLVSLSLGAGIVSLCCSWVPLIGSFAAFVAHSVAFVALHAARLCAHLPYATVVVRCPQAVTSLVVLGICVTVLVFWPRVNRNYAKAALAAAMAMCALVLAGWRFLAPARIVVLDIGQGDAILVQDRAYAILVDTGPDASIRDALARAHVLHLDAIIVTHLHDDHYGGIEHLVGTVPCDEIIVAEGVAAHVEGALAQACEDLTHAGPVEVAYGDTVHVGRFELRVIWPRQPVAGDENAHSIELAVSFNDDTRPLSGLLTGDAEQDVTGACLSSGDIGDIDVLKVGHHGSEVSLAPDQAQALSPELAIASAGEGNSYGHPSPTCVCMLEAAGTQFLCTKDVGDVEVRPCAEGLLVRA